MRGIWNFTKWRGRGLPKMGDLNPSTNYAFATHENGYQPSEDFHTTIGWSIQHF